MKLVLFIIFITLISFEALSLDDKKCKKLSAEALTSTAARIIYSTCVYENSSFYNRSEDFKCAIKAGEAKTSFAARLLFANCVSSGMKSEEYRCALRASKENQNFSARQTLIDCLQ